MTNGDKIRSMSDDELPECDIICPYDDPGECLAHNDASTSCRECVRRWLKEEVDENG